MKMPEYGLGGIKLSCIQLSLPKSELTTLSSNLESDYANRLSIISSVDEQQENEISQLRADLEVLKNRTDPDIVIMTELKQRFGSIRDAKWDPEEIEGEAESLGVKRRLVVTLNDDISATNIPKIKSEIVTFVRNRLQEQVITVEFADEIER